MFRKACAEALEYTIPVVIAHRQVNGICSAGLGAAVIINDEGWFVTAEHIAAQLSELSNQVEQINARPRTEASIRADSSLNRTERQKKLRDVGKPKSTDTQNYSVIWGVTDCEVKRLKSPGHIDIAVGRLDNFDPSSINNYPRFRKKNKKAEPGAMVCRSGFPFYDVQPGWDELSGRFTFPENLFPVPMFANEGIVTRRVQIQVDDEKKPPEFDRILIETSSPGLRGQSGGPIFDNEGQIWGIQSDTMHYPLGFAPKTNGQIEHQFLNVGRGVDAETVTGFLDSLGISYKT